MQVLTRIFSTFTRRTFPIGSLCFENAQRKKQATYRETAETAGEASYVNNADKGGKSILFC